MLRSQLRKKSWEKPGIASFLHISLGSNLICYFVLHLARASLPLPANERAAAIEELTERGEVALVEISRLRMTSFLFFPFPTGATPAQRAGSGHGSSSPTANR